MANLLLKIFYLYAVWILSRAIFVVLFFSSRSFCIHYNNIFYCLQEVWELIFSRVLFKVDLSKKKFPQNDHYNSKLSKSSFIFPGRYKIMVQRLGGTYLAFGFPEYFNYEGPCFPIAVQKTGKHVFSTSFWTEWWLTKKLQQTEIHTGKTKQKQKTNVHNKAGELRSKKDCLRIPWLVQNQWVQKALWVLAPGLLTSLAVAGGCFLWVPC